MPKSKAPKFTADQVADMKKVVDDHLEAIFASVMPLKGTWHGDWRLSAAEDVIKSLTTLIEGFEIPDELKDQGVTPADRAEAKGLVKAANTILNQDV